MNRNIIIVIVILTLAVLAGYLVWLRSKLVPQLTTEIETVEEIIESPLPDATEVSLPTPQSASPSATAKATASPR